jgi:phosphate transport system substrate-binding protein
MKKMLKSTVAAAVALVGFAGVAAPAFATKSTSTKVSCYPLYPSVKKIKATMLTACSVDASTTGAGLTNATATFGVNLGQNGSSDSDLSIPSGVSLNAEGSSFIQPLVMALQSGTGSPAGTGATYWNPNNAVSWSTYVGSGSGTGRANVTGTTGDTKYTGTSVIGFSDQPMTTHNNAGTVPALVTTSDYAQIPAAFGGAVVGYNLPGLNNLKLSASIIASIYNDTILRWDNPAIVNLNGGSGSRLGKALLALPSNEMTIKVLERNASSGTTFAFVDYLNTANSGLPTGVTSGASGAIMDTKGWGATFTGEANNAAMANALATIPGAIGYVEYSYLLIPGNSAIQAAELQDKAGVYLKPSIKSIKAAATAAGTNITPDNFSTVYLPGTGVWPLATFSWAIIKKNQTTQAAKGEAAVKFLDWMVHYGQTQAAGEGFIALPQAIQNYDRAQLMSVVSGTQPLLTLAN